MCFYVEIISNKIKETLMTKQNRYIDDEVVRFNQQSAKMVENPCASDMNLSKIMSPTTEDELAEMRGYSKYKKRFDWKRLRVAVYS